MAPGRRKGSGRAAAAAAAAAAKQQWKVGDLVLAKMKGFPAWPAMVSEPEKWGYSSDRKKLLVYFYGTKQIAFCNYADVEAFTEEKKKPLLAKRQGKGADFVRAVDEIVDVYEKLKMQNLLTEGSNNKFNSGDEGTMSSAGKSEGSNNKSFNRSPELSSNVTNNNQPEALSVLSESHAMLNPEEIPETPMGDYIHDAAAEISQPTGTISILDQLRKTPLANATYSRKRLNGAPLQSFPLQKRTTSFRRSRSSSGHHSHKFQKSTMIDDSTLDGGELVPDSVQEVSTPKDEVNGGIPHTSVSSDAVRLGSAVVPLNGTSEDILSETASLNSEVINLNDGSLLESGCKVELPGMGHSEVGKLNGNFRSTDKLDLPMKTVIVKKKRNLNRKRITSTMECAKCNQEVESEVQPGGSLSESPISRNETNERSHSVDGDEHLPLVKRARVRMSKPPVEEMKFDEIVGTKERSDTTLLIDQSDKYIASSCSENTCPDSRTSASVKEAITSSGVSNCVLSSGKTLMFWNVKKDPSKGIALDVEAALPPSKRLHRALEAMSANSAESTDNCTETPRTLELVHNDTVDPAKLSPLHICASGVVENSTKPESIEPSDSNPFHSSAAILPSCLTSHNGEVAVIASSDAKPDDILTDNLISSNKDYSSTVLDGKHHDESSVPEISDKYIVDKRFQPCLFIEKQNNSTSREGVPNKLCFSESFSGQLSPPVGEENMNQKPQPTKKCSNSPVDSFGGDETVRPSVQNFSISESKVRDTDSAQNGIAPALSSKIAGSMTSNSSRMTKSSIFKSCDDNRARDVQDVAKELKSEFDIAPKDKGVSPDLAPLKDLIAAAQAKRLLSRSSFSDYSVDVKTSDNVVSPSLFHRDESSGQGSLPNSDIYNIHGPGDSLHGLQNGSRNPNAGIHHKGLDKFSNHAEANAARKAFEALLFTLSRTKESIGRATRLAIDCARYGIAGEIVEILLQNLERESSLYRRVDLLFLVDSIAQCSRSHKGGVGDVYLTLVQSTLSRLLSAAAPPGNAAWENRRQCLKVLRVWLERKTLPESIVSHHIRELESANEVSFTSTYSRRQPRTERALNDPIREMEGMLVDEYGSNTSFQLPSFLHPRVFEDEEGSSDDEKSFEAVTPESNVDVDDAMGGTHVSTEKHRHVLEDVDGELEMEDLAPPCEVEMIACNVVNNSHYQLDHHHIVSFAPPLPEEKPPSPPPLPSSPPPLSSSPSMAPPCSTPLPLVPHHQSGGSHALADATDFHLSCANNTQNQPRQSICQQPSNLDNQPRQSICQQPSNLDSNLMPSGAMSYCSTGYAGPPKQLPPAPSLASSNSYSNNPGSHPAIHVGNKNNVQPFVSVPLPSKVYHMQQQPTAVANQFSYAHAEPQQTQQSWGSRSSVPDRFQYVCDNQRGHYFADRGARGLVQHDISERRFSPAVPLGHALGDKVEGTSTNLSLYGPSLEPSTIPCRGWSLPPRQSGYSVPDSRPSLENQISRVTGAPGYWRRS